MQPKDQSRSTRPHDDREARSGDRVMFLGVEDLKTVGVRSSLLLNNGNVTRSE